MNEETTNEPEGQPQVTEGVTFDTDPASTSEPADAQSASPEVSETSQPEPAADEPKKGGVQKRFDELTAARRQAERQAELLEQENQALKAQIPQQPQQPQPQTQGAPRLEQFDDYDQYVVALAEHNVMQKLQEQQRQNMQHQQEQQHQQKVQDFQARANELRAKHEDFDIVAFNPNVQINQAMEQVILSDETGPELAYYLGNNPQEAQRIAQLDPYSGVMAMAELKAKLTAPPPTTQAPDPVGSVSGVDSTPPEYTGAPGVTYE